MESILDVCLEQYFFQGVMPQYACVLQVLAKRRRRGTNLYRLILSDGQHHYYGFIMRLTPEEAYELDLNCLISVKVSPYNYATEKHGRSEVVLQDIAIILKGSQLERMLGHPMGLPLESEQ